MAGNASLGVSTGLQTAQIGGQLGGGLGAIIGGLGGLVLGWSTTNYEKIAREKYNNEVVKNTATALFDMRRVQNVESLRTAQALAAYQDNQRVTASQYNAQYGAADIIGGSAAALNQVLDFQTEQAKAQTWFNYQTGIDNYNTAVEGTVNSANAGLRRTKGDQRTLDLASLTKVGLDMYKQYGGSFSNAMSSLWGGSTTTQSVLGGGLGGLSDFGSFGKGGSASGLTGGSSLA